MCYGAVDLGTTFVKTHLGDIFASGISTTIHNMALNVMTVDGKQYAMEQLNEKSDYDTNSDKSLNSNLKLNFLYALHKITSDLGIYKGIVINSPASQWKNNDNVNTLKELLKFEEEIIIDVNGDKKEIYVDELIVVPEDSAVYYTNEVNKERFNKRRVLIIGLGSWNMNTILFENDEIIDLDTDEIGCLRMFKDMLSVINTNYNSNIHLEQMFDTFVYGLNCKGKIINIREDVEDIAFNYAKQIYKSLKVKWSVDNIPYVLFTGGGSCIMQDYLCKYIPHVESLPNAQTLAAKGMGEIARMCFFEL